MTTGRLTKRLAIGVAAIALGAVPAQAETLREALATAYQNNPILEAQRAGVRAEDENVSQALSGYRPAITGQANITKERSRNFFSPTGGKQTLTPITAAVSLEQPIFRSFRTFNAVKESKTRVEAARSDLVSTEQDVLLITVAAYMDVLRDQAVLELRRNNVQVLDRQLGASRDRFEVGEITRTDVAQSEARMSGSISSRTAAEADLTASRTAYERIVGNAPGTLEQPEPMGAMPTSEANAIQIALAENPELKAARLEEEAARQAISTAKSELGPEVSLVAQYQYQEDQFVQGFSSGTQSIMARATVPIYAAGVTSSRIRQAKQINSQRRMQAIETEREIREAVSNAWERLRAARAIIESSKSQVEANKIALEGVRQEQEVGSRTTLDVLDAEQEALDAEVELVRAQREEYVASFQLLSALGRATAESLNLPVERYDPEQYYDHATGSWFGWGTGD
ncbi:TolC family outer membrane protein [Emcibacter sp. SYSU 3D8]|uniref:TolC family outer membrane protein n=1 Tax=Emcibacter sp. SYSU 3D8 TaxID=3133969 RepID=UPI0031FE598E